jgi:2-phosphoglycerate kinase
LDSVPFKVLIIGGPPMAGKTTLGRKLAAQLGWLLISGDDLSLAAKGVTLRTTHPALHPMNGIDHREYYVRHSVEELIAHARAEHEALREGLRKVIYAHATWADPAVIEGWQFHPRWIAAMNLANVRSMWLDPDAETLAARVRQNVDFYRGASDKEAMIAHWLGRSLWHRGEIAAAARELALPVVPVTAAGPADIRL